MANYIPTANTSEIRNRLYEKAIQLGNASQLSSWTGFSLQNAPKAPRKRRQRPLNFKIVVLGDAGTGKTSLIARYFENRDIYQPEPSRYGEYHTRNLVLGERLVGVQVWDVPQHILVNDLNDECFLQRTHGAIIIYDVTSRRSFENAENYLRKIRRYAHPGAMCLLAANKSDLLMPPTANHDWVTDGEGSKFAEGFSMEFMEVSAITGLNVNLAINSILQALNDAASNYFDKINRSMSCSESSAAEDNR